MEETEKKKGKTWLLVLMFIIILVLAGYIIYEKVFTSPQKEVESVESTVEKKDITDQDIAKTLHDSLITKDNLSGVYYGSKITPNKENDERFIAFAITDYISENNVVLKQDPCGAPGEETNNYISKEDFNSYVNKKYNTSIKYDLPLYDEQNPDSSKSYFLYHDYRLESYPEKWAVTCNGENGTGVYSKMTKAEQEGDYIYIYDVATFCTTNDIFFYCFPNIDEKVEDSLITCSKCTESECKNDTLCPTNQTYSLEDVANVLLERTPEKLLKYKHTLKKQGEKYYWTSTEVEQ